MAKPDQAHHLRELTKGLASGSFILRARKKAPPKIIAVASGRGGVGKSFLALNFACIWASKRKNVILVDTDFAMGQLDYLLGFSPERTIQHIVEGKSSLEDTMLLGPWGMKLVPGMAGLNGSPNFPSNFARDLVPDIAMHDDWADIVLCDTASGVSAPTVDVISCCDEIILITTPETGSVMDLYGMIKFLHGKFGKNLPRLNLVVNRSASRADGRRVAKSIRDVTGRFLGQGLNFLGQIPSELAVEESVKKHTPLINHSPASIASRSINEMSEFLLAEWSDPLREEPEN